MKKSKRTLTPKLRFPEFRKEPGWNEVPLEKIAERTTTKNLDGSIARVLTNSAEHGVLDQRDYFDKDIANAGNIDGYYIVDFGDYVYNPRISTLAPVGPISRNNIGKGVMSPLYTVFRFTDKNTDFYQYYFKTASWHLYLRRVSSMGARHDRMSITTGDFMAMPVPTPLPQEQQKIADCLSSLDGLIAAEGRKLAALRDHKRGLMQQLFPRKGETQPRLRFPEFRNAPEWKAWPLAKLAREIHDGDWIESKDQSPSGIRLVQTGNIGEGLFINKEDNARFVSESTFKRLRCKEIHPGDCLVSRLPDPIGRACLLPDTGSRMITAVDCAIIRFRLDKIVPHLFIALSQRSEYYREVASLASGSTRKRISRTKLAEVELCLPEMPEQRRIADCLSALDARIAGQSAKLDALRTHKRGLMQQLFPSPEDAEA
jgi:type I restriction enzyme S subunit